MCSFMCKKYRYVSATVPRVRHLLICTQRVPPGKDKCFPWVLTGVSVLHPENCVWLLVCRWWQEKQFQVSPSYWRPRGSGLCIPWARWWEQGEQSRERELQSLPSACRQRLAGERRQHPGLLSTPCSATGVLCYGEQLHRVYSHIRILRYSQKLTIGITMPAERLFCWYLLHRG